MSWRIIFLNVGDDEWETLDEPGYDTEDEATHVAEVLSRRDQSATYAVEWEDEESFDLDPDEHMTRWDDPTDPHFDTKRERDE